MDENNRKAKMAALHAMLNPLKQFAHQAAAKPEKVISSAVPMPHHELFFNWNTGKPTSERSEEKVFRFNKKV